MGVAKAGWDCANLESDLWERKGQRKAIIEISNVRNLTLKL